MRNYLLPYKAGSHSVSALKEALGIKTLRLNGSRVTPNHVNTIINWGSSSTHPAMGNNRVCNMPDRVAVASNKRLFFETVTQHPEVNLPEFSVRAQDAEGWPIIVVREKLTGHSGEGIVILEGEEEFNNYDHNKARLYVKYIKKEHEYRVHVFSGKVIDIRRKALRNDVDRADVDWKVRNHKGGFIYAKELGHTPHPDVYEQAIKTISCLGLDFGAVDIIYNSHERKPYVLEVNTAPGLEGSSVDIYVEAIKEWVNENV